MTNKSPSNPLWNVEKTGSWKTIFVKDGTGNLCQHKERAESRIVRGVLIEKGIPMPKKRTVTVEEAVAAAMEIGDCAVLATEDEAEEVKSALKDIKRTGKEFQYVNNFNHQHWRVFRVE